MRTLICGNSIAVQEFIAELTGEENPWVDSGTKVISLKIPGHVAIRAEALAQFGNKKRADVLKAAVEFGLDAIISSLNEEKRSQLEKIHQHLKIKDADS